MGRYADLSFLREGQVPENAGDFVAREAWLGRLMASLMLFALGAGVPVAGYLALGEAGGGWRIDLSLNALYKLLAVGIVGLIGLLVCRFFDGSRRDKMKQNETPYPCEI